jgi:hypothetical protein
MLSTLFAKKGSVDSVRDDPNVAFKIDSRFTAAKPPPDFRINVCVGLKPDLQAIFGVFSLRLRSKGSSISDCRG